MHRNVNISHAETFTNIYLNVTSSPLFKLLRLLNYSKVHFCLSSKHLLCIKGMAAKQMLRCCANKDWLWPLLIFTLLIHAVFALSCWLTVTHFSSVCIHTFCKQTDPDHCWFSLSGYFLHLFFVFDGYKILLQVSTKCNSKLHCTMHSYFICICPPWVCRPSVFADHCFGVVPHDWLAVCFRELTFAYIDNLAQEHHLSRLLWINTNTKTILCSCYIGNIAQ